MNVLVINNVETILGFDELIAVCDSLNDVSRHEHVFEELAKSDSLELKVSVASRRRISKNTVNLLIQDLNLDVLRALSKNRYAMQHFDRKAIRALIDSQDEDIYISIAEGLKDYAQIFNVECLCENLIQGGSAVKYILASNPETPVFFLTELAQDPDVSVSERAKRTLQNDNDDE
ncbi:MAG: hypothetical protein SWH61_05205 [Thermodesulfobacteriota bacterium]|nr:hypothetical protein [Thermodesulfobacteriota bacterium]